MQNMIFSEAIQELHFSLSIFAYILELQTNFKLCRGRGIIFLFGYFLPLKRDYTLAVLRHIKRFPDLKWFTHGIIRVQFTNFFP